MRGHLADEVVRVNIKGTFAPMRAFAEFWTKNSSNGSDIPRRKIICTTSRFGLRGTPYDLTYGCTRQQGPRSARVRTAGKHLNELALWLSSDRSEPLSGRVFSATAERVGLFEGRNERHVVTLRPSHTVEGVDRALEFLAQSELLASSANRGNELIRTAAGISYSGTASGLQHFTRHSRYGNGMGCFSVC